MAYYKTKKQTINYKSFKKYVICFDFPYFLHEIIAVEKKDDQGLC